MFMMNLKQYPMMNSISPDKVGSYTVLNILFTPSLASLAKMLLRNQDLMLMMMMTTTLTQFGDRIEDETTNVLNNFVQPDIWRETKNDVVIKPENLGSRI